MRTIHEGQIRNARVYDRALTAEEVEDMSESQSIYVLQQYQYDESELIAAWTDREAAIQVLLGMMHQQVRLAKMLHEAMQYAPDVDADDIADAIGIDHEYVTGRLQLREWQPKEGRWWFVHDERIDTIKELRDLVCADL